MKFFGWLFVIVILLGVGAYVVYKVYLPEMVANALVNDEAPAYVPEFVQQKIQKYKAPVNEGAGDIITEIHKSNVSLDEVLEAVDRTDPDRVRAMMDELSQQELRNTDQVFDIAKKYFYTEFDIEVLRRPFNENVDLDMVQAGLKKAAEHQREETVDIEMTKAIIKQVLIQKEKEYQSTSGIQ